MAHVVLWLGPCRYRHHAVHKNVEQYIIVVVRVLVLEIMGIQLVLLIKMFETLGHTDVQILAGKLYLYLDHVAGMRHRRQRKKLCNSWAYIKILTSHNVRPYSPRRELHCLTCKASLSLIYFTGEYPSLLTMSFPTIAFLVSVHGLGK